MGRRTPRLLAVVAAVLLTACGPFAAGSEDGVSGAGIYVINADRSGLTRLASSRSIVSSPAWSPDGTRIAFDSQPMSEGGD